MTGEEVLALLRKIDNGYKPTEAKKEELSSIEKITWNNMESIPESIGILTNLQSLDLSNTKISSLPESIWNLTNLQSLDLSGTNIRAIPDSVGNLTSLQSLDLHSTQISALPKSIVTLTSLKRLNLIYSQISTLPENIGNLTSLQSLDLSNTKISSLPESIWNLTNLQSLDLSGTNIRAIPDSVGNLTSLQSLDLHSTQISALPKSIVTLTSLKRLNLSFTQISTLPENIWNLTSLQFLFLGVTKLCEIPESVENLTSLQRLVLSDTWITELPENIGKLKSLQILDLSNTQISSLPESIWKLTRLQGLVLSNTQISSLPESIGNLTNLQRLNLSFSCISTLPKSIGNLMSLQSLDLSSTKLSEIPESIGNLTSLKYLFLEDLTLTELPESLLNLNLEYIGQKFVIYENWPGIYIIGLTLTNQDITIFSQSREFIIEYYASTKDKALPINECKVVFLGDGGAGKSLIIDRLMHDGSISDDFDGESTPGIHISSKKYSIGNEEIELHFWDFGGQAIMHSMHRLFLTNRTLYVVVTNARDNKENEQAWYWIRNIKSFANNAPVLLLVNQRDQNPSANVNENGLRKEYPELKQVRVVSALKDTKEEFDREICDAICQIVSDMETVHTPFSRSWLALMNDLQEMKEEYITSGAFYEMCNKNHVDTERVILDQIIRWYQDLGVCFYSKAHPVTAQYMVLKPRWLLNALYILVFNGRKYAVNGIISEKDIHTLICERVSDDVIKKVWSEIIYKPNEIQYIINVLLNYELIYRLDAERFFIPMLCDENEPEVMDLYDSEEVFHVSFEYAYLPDNVLHRLMVRHGYELNTDVVWRTGATFEREQLGWSSLIRIKDNCLDVYAKADNQKEHPVNTYLDMIRESICNINDEFGIVGNEYIAYRKDGKEDRFKYSKLIGSKKEKIDRIYSDVFETSISIDEILGIIRRPKDQMIQGVIDQMLSVLGEMTEECVNFNHRGEVVLTADFQRAIAPVLNEKYGLQTAREYTMGRAKKKIGETDLYFFTYNDGIKQEQYILENKIIDNFTDQYGQLMGYLNPNFSAGITLSINTKKGWEEAYDFIDEKLNLMMETGETFAPVSINRFNGDKGTRYIQTEHIVPETGLTMPVYHLVLQLSDDDRLRAARKARK